MYEYMPEYYYCLVMTVLEILKLMFLESNNQNQNYYMIIRIIITDNNPEPPRAFYFDRFRQISFMANYSYDVLDNLEPVLKRTTTFILVYLHLGYVK